MKANRNTKSFVRDTRVGKRVETKTHKQAMFRAGVNTDDVNGIICGDSDIKFMAALFYDGRPQGGSFWARNDLEIYEMADKLKAEFIDESHEWQYQDEMLWEVRIYD